MASSSSSANTAPQPPPPAAKKTFLRRLLPVLLVTNVAVGVYVFIKTSKNEQHQKDGESTEKVPSTPAAISSVAVPEKNPPTESSAPIAAIPPIPEKTQRELLKWILEEKRKLKPQNPSEKKKIDEEKAFLKELLRSKSIPNL